MHFTFWMGCVCHIHCKVHWRVGKSLGFRRLHLIVSNNHWIRYELCSLFVWCFVLSILTQFLPNRSQYVLEDGCRSKPVNVVSGVPHGSVLGQLFSFLFALDISFYSVTLAYLICRWLHFEFCCAISRSSSCSCRDLNRDLGKVSEWCDIWGIKLNANETKIDYDSLKLTHDAIAVTYWESIFSKASHPEEVMTSN